MSISAVPSVFSSVGIQSIGSTSGQPAAVGSSSAASGVSVDISKPGQLLSSLTSLATSNPAQFKSVTATIAQQLKDAASSQSGSSADFLNKLADRFSTASQSGKASDLTPDPGKAHAHHGHHGGHHHAQASSGSSSGGSGAATATGAGAPDSVGSIVEGIISNALESANG
jgi:hypothetical protein